MASILHADLKSETPCATRVLLRRQGLLSAAQRLLMLAVLSIPTFAIVTVLLWPFSDAEGLRSWFVACIALSLFTAGSTLVRWRRLPHLTSEELRKSLVWIFGIPAALQWGSASILIRPATDYGTLVLAIVIFIAASAVFAAAGAACPGLTLVLVGLIVASNMAATAMRHGLLADPSMLMLFGTAATFAVGLLARREFGQREALVAQSEELLRTVTTERSSLSALNAELRFRATHDRLMGIPNRELLHSELEQALEITHTDNGDRNRVGLLFLDLDRFKVVNDTYGHQAGDALLVMVGGRIQAALAAEDALVARVGGDELVVLLRCLDSDDHLGSVAQAVLAKFVDPFTIDGVQLDVGSSIGMAESVVGETADDLYRHADAALYEAKQAGRGRAVVADRALRNKRAARIRTEVALRSALNDQEIEAWFQPEVDLYSGQVVAGEALARWRLGNEVALAGSFIDTAQRAGLLEPLMFEMCQQVWHWRRVTESRVPISVNVSIADLDALLAFHEAAPADRPFVGLRLEIAERDIIRDFRGARTKLHRVRDLGAEVFLDDFGVGFSSLRMLSDLPIDGLKIDRSYVARVEHDLRVRQLVTSLAEFGRNCAMVVVAEGVETACQVEFLMQIGIDRGQGRLFSPAVEPHRFDELVRHGCRSAQLVSWF